MSTGRKPNSSSNTGVRASKGNVDAAKKWVAEETRTEAKEVFAQHTRETSNLDVLSRCKKLNELLSSDVLKGKGDAKAQLKEILGILHAGPKRPAFLDKPPITATAGKRGTVPESTPERPVGSPCGPRAGLSDGGEGAGAPRSTDHESTLAPLQRPSNDVEDIINLLNDTPRASTDPHFAESRVSCKQQEDADRQRKEEEVERRRREREAQEEAECKRREKEAQEEAECRRKAKEAAEEAERKRKAQEEEDRRRAAAAAEARRQQQLREAAALRIQTQWRGHCARRQVAQRRQQLAQERAAAAAACVLQSAWRTRQVLRAHRHRLAAAGTLQCAIRAWRARRHLQDLRVEAFVRQRAARIIQRAFCAYRARGYTLAPLRVPGAARPLSGLDGAALLAKQLRLRSAMDARLAPECGAGGSGGQDDDGARTHRTVVTHMERVRQVSASERNRRCDVGERAIMVASEHRDTAEALAIARQGFGTSTPRALSPSTSWIPPVDTSGSESRRGSAGVQGGPDAGGHAHPAHSEATSSLAMRPPSGMRRL